MDSRSWQGNTLTNNLNRANLVMKNGIWQTLLPSMAYRVKYTDGEEYFSPDDINDIEVYFAFNFTADDTDKESFAMVSTFQTLVDLMKKMHEAMITLHLKGTDSVVYFLLTHYVQDIRNTISGFWRLHFLSPWRSFKPVLQRIKNGWLDGLPIKSASATHSHT